MSSETMRLNSLSPAPGSRKNVKRVGRGDRQWLWENLRARSQGSEIPFRR